MAIHCVPADLFRDEIVDWVARYENEHKGGRSGGLAALALQADLPVDSVRRMVNRKSGFVEWTFMDKILIAMGREGLWHVPPYDEWYLTSKSLNLNAKFGHEYKTCEIGHPLIKTNMSPTGKCLTCRQEQDTMSKQDSYWAMRRDPKRLAERRKKQREYWRNVGYKKRKERESARKA